MYIFDACTFRVVFILFCLFFFVCRVPCSKLKSMPISQTLFPSFEIGHGIWIEIFKLKFTKIHTHTQHNLVNICSIVLNASRPVSLFSLFSSLARSHYFFILFYFLLGGVWRSIWLCTVFPFHFIYLVTKIVFSNSPHTHTRKQWHVCGLWHQWQGWQCALCQSNCRINIWWTSQWTLLQKLCTSHAASDEHRQ